MAISFSLETPSGVTATYHVVRNINWAYGDSVNVTVNSYLNSDAYAANPGITPITANYFNFQQSAYDMTSVENALLTTPTFTGGSIVA